MLQQIEGNFIYPHVVGGSVGLPSIWVLVAVMLGGDLMGILGMLIFVPLFSVLYALSEEYVVKNLKAKGISWKKYNLACNIPEGRWNGRLDEECASEVHAGSKKVSAGQNVSGNTKHGKESGIQSDVSETNVSGGTFGGSSNKDNTKENANRPNNINNDKSNSRNNRKRK